MAENIIHHPSSTSNWHALVVEASQKCLVSLSQDIESYLVFLLMRFTQSPEIAKSVVCLDLLNSAHLGQSEKHSKLRDVGDTCLLYSGLFPGRARKKRVRISYFIQIGRTAYSALAEPDFALQNELSTLFAELNDQFVPLMDVLHTMRELDNQDFSLDPLQAEELWTDTGSQHALQILQKISNNFSTLEKQTLSQLKH